MGLECEIFMGKEDTVRQALNVYRMELLGAKVHPVTTGTMTLKDAVNEAMREWVCFGFCNGTSSFSYDCKGFSIRNFKRSERADT